MRVYFFIYKANDAAAAAADVGVDAERFVLEVRTAPVWLWL